MKRETPSMVIAVALVAFMLAMLAGGCTSVPSDRYRWERVAIVEDVAITVEAVGLRGLGEVMAEYRATSGGRVLPAMTRSRLGFAVLVRRAGEYHCTIYVADATDAETLEHERRHCFGWTHD